MGGDNYKHVLMALDDGTRYVIHEQRIASRDTYVIVMICTQAGVTETRCSRYANRQYRQTGEIQAEVSQCCEVTHDHSAAWRRNDQ